MYNPDLIIPFVLIGILCLLHLFLTIKKNKSDNKLLQDEHFILQKQIAVQEETFQKISAEIHDNISLTLSLSRLYLHDIDAASNEVSDRINCSASLIKRAIDDLNNLSKSLSSEAIEKFGLIKAIEEQVNDVRKAGMFEIDFNVNGVQRSFGSYVELIIFRMIQESFNNIIRHANANEVRITVAFETTALSIEIVDNGVGFSTATTNLKTTGSGLGNIRKRAQLLHAQLHIASLPHAGTTIRIRVPVNDKLQLNASRKFSH